ncbi:MAG: hypothetical protein Q9222_003259 [Ikaeria aurantiellina]
MFSDPAARPHSLAIRTAQDAYRSMPGTPLGMDPRAVHSVDLAAAMNNARMGLEGGDYFLGAPKFPNGSMRPRSPMPPLAGQDWDHENALVGNGFHNGPFGYRERDLEDQIRRENSVAALLNAAILPPAKYAQVYPLRCDDGTLPADFKSPKTVEAMKVLDSK